MFNKTACAIPRSCASRPSSPASGAIPMPRQLGRDRPGDGRDDRHGAGLRRRRDPRGDRGRRGRLSGLAPYLAGRARRDPGALERLILENAEGPGGDHDREQGKPLAEARGEVAYGASFVKWFAEEARRITATCSTRRSATAGCWCSRSRSASCAAITPWNFPIAMITPQGGAGLRRRLPDRGQARRPDAVLGAGARGAGRAGRGAEGRVQRRHRPGRPDRRRDDRQRDCAQAVLHRSTAIGGC